MIQTLDLTYQYPGSSPIIFPDLKVEAGHALLVTGESGCGKTTLLHLLAGLRRPSNGKVLVDNINVSDLSSSKMDQYRGQNIGIVYQQPYFIESLSIIDNLMISPYTLNRSAADKIAGRLNIKELLQRYPHQISVGQQQRATIARAVMIGPKLILADEPTSALDNKNCRQVIELLREEAITNDASLIIVTHDDRLKSEIQNSIELNSIYQ